MGEAAKLAAAVAVAPQRYTLSGRKRTEPEKFIAESSRESNDREDSIRSEARRGALCVSFVDYLPSASPRASASVVLCVYQLLFF